MTWSVTWRSLRLKHCSDPLVLQTGILVAGPAGSRIPEHREQLKVDCRDLAPQPWLWRPRLLGGRLFLSMVPRLRRDPCNITTQVCFSACNRCLPFSTSVASHRPAGSRTRGASCPALDRSRCCPPVGTLAEAARRRRRRPLEDRSPSVAHHSRLLAVQSCNRLGLHRCLTFRCLDEAQRVNKVRAKQLRDREAYLLLLDLD